MKILPFTLCLILLSLTPGSSVSADELGNAVKAAMRKVEPSIVRLRVIGGEQSVDGDAVTSLVTTGIVISEDGEILTSQFALEGNPEAVLVEDWSGKRTNATVIATDSVRRIVLLKAKEGRWTPVVADDSHSVEVGQWSIALGRFYAAESSSISVGIISAQNRIHGMAIQTDAKVSPVNYGGPLVMLNGTIAGILVPLSPQGGGTSSSGIEWYDSGIGFAIPLKDALTSAQRLRSGKNLEPGKIGIRLVPAGAFDANVVIDRVLPGGPSEKSGMIKGDRILMIDGEPLERNSVLMESIARRYAGDSVTFRLQRGEAEITAVVELVEALAPVAQGYLGLLPVRLAKQYDDIRKQAGDSVPLIVVNDSPAAALDVPPEIELISVNGTVTTSPAELAMAIEEIVPGAVAEIEYRIPGETEQRSIAITAGIRPETVTELSDVVLEQIRKSRPSTVVDSVTADAAEPAVDLDDASEKASKNGVSRQEFNFEERGRCVVLSSTQTRPVVPGIVILLSADDTSEEEIVRDWGAVLQSHSLTVIIPRSPESTRLTKDDIPLVMTSLRAAVSRAGADLRRVVVVADRTQSSLAWQCAFGGPSAVRGVALTDGWIADAAIQGVEGAGRSVLLLDQSQDAQANSLRALSGKSLTNAGFWAPRPTASAIADDSNERVSRCIADWTFLMRSF